MQNAITNSYSWMAEKISKITAVLGKNAKVFIATQLFFSLPAVWFNTYWALYLIDLGATKEYIGYLASGLITVQVLVSFLSVFLSERLGHKRTYITVSFICWPAAMLVYALSGNVFLSSAAIIVSNMFMLADPSFVILYIKDVKKNKMHSAFAILNILFTGASFFSPVAGIFIKKFGIHDGGRLVFILGAFMMSLSVGFRAFFLKEPAGLRPVKSSLLVSLKKYRHTFLEFLKNSYLVKVLLLDTLMMFNVTVINTYSSIYLTDKSTVALDSSVISYFPSINAAFNIVLSLFLVPIIKAEEVRKYLKLAMLSGILAWGLLLFAPKGNFWFVAASYALHGLWFALYFPLIMLLLLRYLKNKNKAVFFSIFNVFALSASIPAGVIAGKLYIRNPKLPFIMVTFIFIFTLLILGKVVPVSKQK